jgi:hypothetical protein
LSFIEGNFLLAAGLLVVLEDDDLGILSAQLDDRIHFGMQLLDGERNAVTSCTNLAPIWSAARRRPSRS